MEQFVKESPDLFIGSHERIFQIIKEIHDVFDMQNYETARKAHRKSESLLLEDNVVKKAHRKFESLLLEDNAVKKAHRKFESLLLEDNVVKKAHRKFESLLLEDNVVKKAHRKFESLLLEDNVVKKFAEFEKDRENNVQLQWVYIYMRMQQMHMLFRHTSRARKWRLHLKACEDLIKDITCMDRIKYLRLLPVYVAEMIVFEVSSPTIWQHLLEGNFRSKEVKYLSLLSDHAGEQQNVGGGIVGITKNENACLRFFFNGTSFGEHNSGDGRLHIKEKQI